MSIRGLIGARMDVLVDAVAINLSPGVHDKGWGKVIVAIVLVALLVI